MYAAAGQCFCYLIITILIRFNEMPGYAHQTEVAKASVAFFFLYYVFFGIGFQVSCSRVVAMIVFSADRYFRVYLGCILQVSMNCLCQVARARN